MMNSMWRRKVDQIMYQQILSLPATSSKAPEQTTREKKRYT